MNIYFYPKKSRRALSTLYVKIMIDDMAVEMSTGLKVKPLDWDKDNDLMEFTHNLRRRLIQVHNALVKENATVTAQRVREAYLAKYIDIHTVIRELDAMIARATTDVKIGNRSKAMVQKHNVFRRHLKGYLGTKGLPDVTFDQVTVDFLQELETYIKKNGCSHNTTKKHMDIMRKLYRYAKANKWAENDPFYFYRISERPVKREPLNEAELKELLHHNFIDRVNRVRDVFIVQCFTGMSYSDVKRFSKAMTYTDAEGTIWVDSSRVKTGVDFDVPLLPQIVQLLEKYDFKLPVLSNQKMNDYLKSTGDILGFNKQLTTHLARRTFASILNEKGVNITAIQKMLGHSKITTTQHYITTNRQFLKEEMGKLALGIHQIFGG